MARTSKKQKELTHEEKLTQALVPVEEQPYPIPENWCWMRLASLKCSDDAFFDGDWILGENMDPNGSVRLLQLSDIGTGSFLDKSNKHISKDTFDELGCTSLKQGDLMISRMAEPIARSCIVPDFPYTVITAVDVAVLRCNQDIVNNKYVNYLCNTEWFTTKAHSLARGTTRVRITRKNLGNMPVPLPPLAEQQRIVDRIESLFSKLDEAKEKAQSVIDGYEDRKSAILHQAFSGELTENWRNDNDVSRDEWIKVSLSDVCIINPPKTNVKDFSDDCEVSFFPMPSLSEKFGEITEPQIRLLGEVKTGYTRFLEGDVVFAKITPCMENGKSAVIGKLLNDIGFGTTEFFVLRCGEKINNRFLWYILRDRSFRDKAKAEMTGAVGQQRVPKKFLEDYQLALPPILEQKAIINILDDCFEKELKAFDCAEAVIAQIESVKNALLAFAFRGGLETGSTDDEPANMLLGRIL